ncbi:hypothetical protein HDU96_007742 [Phlyctochytrium bullatum]|nr:hypothetical protein HDU96_007742 [Phlyctochytrium bullatum]
MSASELSQYQFQLEQVEEALQKDPENKELQKLQSDLKDLISLLEQEAGLQAAQSQKHSGDKRKNHSQPKERSQPPPKENANEEADRARRERSAGSGAGESENLSDLERDLEELGDGSEYQAKWIKGQTVLAKYKDGKFYEATVENVPAPGNGFYVVVFKGYTSKERVHIANVRDFDPTQAAKPNPAVTGGVNQKKRPTPKTFAQAFGNGMDRRSKKKQRLLEHQETMKALESEHLHKQKAWQSFASGGKKVTLKTAAPLKKQSMFSTPEDPNARVGVIGSGKPMTQFQNRGKHIYERVD